VPTPGLFPQVTRLQHVPTISPAQTYPSRAHHCTSAQPASERASAVSFAFSGLHVGAMVGLITSPLIIQAAGWPALFASFGLAGGCWLLAVRCVLEDIESRDPALAARLGIHTPRPPTGTSAATRGGGNTASHLAAVPVVSAPTSSRAGRSSSASISSLSSLWHEEWDIPREQDAEAERQLLLRQPPAAPIPYRAFLRSPAVRALAFTHFAHNWFHYCWLAWLPTYLTSTLSIDLMHAAQTALLPPIAGLVASTVAGRASDALIQHAGVPLPTVRKMAQATAFLAPAAFLAAAAVCASGPEDSGMLVACITAALGMSNFSLAGLYCTHADMSPKCVSAHCITHAL
jgi:MFS transporter, ACS family, solute carrier family 17 (sodium-dependent inorganic phosphate cotransporter), other